MATHVVEHKRLYLAVEGKLTHIPKGRTLKLTAKQAAKMGNRVSPIDASEAVDLGSVETESKRSEKK